MSAMLGKALEGLGLQPGQTYRTTVEGHEVEVRVLDNNTPSPDLTVQVMLQPWVEFPLPSSGGRVIARRAPRAAAAAGPDGVAGGVRQRPARRRAQGEGVGRGRAGVVKATPSSGSGV